MEPLTREKESSVSAVARAPVRSVAVVGLGYVGLPLAIAAEEGGYDVRGFDIDAIKIALLARRRAPFLDPEDAAAFLGSHMPLSTDEDTLDGADAYLIAVPTPVTDAHVPDLEPLRSACEIVGRHLRRGALVVVESTVNPGVCERVALPALSRASSLASPRDFFFAHCPERVNPGDAVWRASAIPRVIGAADAESLSRATAFYRSILANEPHAMASIKEAEAVKMVENAFRDVNIAFVNELAMAFARADIDITRVLAGAATKPFGFLPHAPGCGVGGHCIPVDPYYLIRYGEENGFEHSFLKAARRVNERMPGYTVTLARNLLRERGRALRGAKVALLGLSYKRDIPDLRESPALAIREKLRAQGARVRAYDPFFPDLSEYADIDDALDGADAAVIATDHSVFRSLSPDTFTKHDVRVVVDGRNCLSKEAYLAAGVGYRGIGR